MSRRNAAKCFLTLLSLFLLPWSAQAQGIVGNWQGTLAVDGTTLRLVLRIHTSENGTLSATLDSLDQDAANIPVNAITFQGSTLAIDVAQVDGSFEGKLSKDGSEIKGNWTEGKRLPLTFKRVADAAKIVPPVPIDGDWQATLIEGGKQLHLALHLDAGHYTTLTASIDGLEGTDDGTIVDQMTFTENALRFRVDSVHGSYFGAANEDGSEIEGVWTQGQAYPLTFTRLNSPVPSTEAPKGSTKLPCSRSEQLCA